jgi:hypothetical protein
MTDSNTAAEGARLIGMLVGGLVGIAIFLVPFIFFLLTLQKAFNRCSPESRAMQPGMVWLMLIPLFNLVWQFFVVLNLTKSLAAEFRKRGIAVEPEPGKTMGLVMCILFCCGIIPFLGILCSLAGLVFWIIYWVKIAGFSSKLAAPAGAPV